MGENGLSESQRVSRLGSTRYKGRGVRAELKPKGVTESLYTGQFIPQQHGSTQLKMKPDSLQRRDAAILIQWEFSTWSFQGKSLPIYAQSSQVVSVASFLHMTAQLRFNKRLRKSKKVKDDDHGKRTKKRNWRRRIQKQIRRKNSESLKEIQEGTAYIKYKLDE